MAARRCAARVDAQVGVFSDCNRFLNGRSFPADAVS